MSDTIAEYAKNLTEKMWVHTFSRELPRSGYNTAKICAIVCVRELIDQARSGYDYDAEAEIPFFEEVLKEIETL